MAFGKKLEAALQMKNMKPGTLATKAGISKNTIYSIIQRDSTKVDLSMIHAISEVLDVDIGYFLSPDENELQELQKNEPIVVDELTEKEQRFVDAFTALSPSNRHTLLVIAEALLRDQAERPDSQE